MAFFEHGSMRVDVDFPLLFTHVDGPWNVELVQRWAEQARPYAEAFAKQGAWVGGGVMTNSMLCTPDALDLHREVAQQMVQGLGAVAAVHVALPGTEGADVMHAVFARMFADLCPYAQFDNVEQAKQWSLAQIAAHSG